MTLPLRLLDSLPARDIPKPWRDSETLAGLLQIHQETR
jgi:hypothetical protein